MHCALVFMFTYENIIFHLSLHAVSPNLWSIPQAYFEPVLEDLSEMESDLNPSLISLRSFTT